MKSSGSHFPAVLQAFYWGSSPNTVQRPEQKLAKIPMTNARVALRGELRESIYAFFRLNHNTSCFFSHVYIPRNKQQKKKRNEHINLLKLGSSSQVSDTIYTLAWFNWINNQSWSFILSLHFPSQRCAIYCFVGPTLPHVGGVCCCCVEPIGQASPLCCPPREVWGSSLSEPGAPAFKSFVAFHANWIVFARFFSHHTKREIEWIMVDFMGGDRKGLRILRSAKVSKTIVFLEVTGPKLYNLH